MAAIPGFRPAESAEPYICHCTGTWILQLKDWQDRNQQTSGSAKSCDDDDGDDSEGLLFLLIQSSTLPAEFASGLSDYQDVRHRDSRNPVDRILQSATAHDTVANEVGARGTEWRIQETN